MDNARVGALLILCSAVGFGTLGVLGVIAGDAGLSIPTILFLRFLIATVLVWSVLGAVFNRWKASDQVARIRELKRKTAKCANADFPLH